MNIEEQIKAIDEVINELLLKLKQSEINLNIIVNSEAVHLIIPRNDRLYAERDAYQRWLKYMEKKGKNFNAYKKINVANGFRLKTLLEVGTRNILGYCGIRGPQQMIYMDLGYSVAKEIKNEKLRYWPEILMKELKFEAPKFQLDPTIAKIVVLVAAMITYDFLYGELGKPLVSYNITDESEAKPSDDRQTSSSKPSTDSTP